MSKKATETGLPLSDATDSSGPGAELAPIVKAEVVPVDASPAGVLQMINNAMEKGHDPDTMGKLYDLYKSMKADAAREAYNAAMLGFQNACPVIHKNKTAKVVSKRTGGSHSYDYASLDYVATTIRPHLQRHGLSYSWENDTTAPPETVRIITTIRHVGGHSERFTGPLFPCRTDAAMGPQQVVGNTESYAKRYGLLSALGLTAGGEDNDAAPRDQFITEDQAATLEALLDETKADRAKFLRFAKVDQMAHIPQSQYRKLVHMLESKR